jgi:hypothetical protein
LNASTIEASTSESGGVWLVQNLTVAAVAAQLAPVTGVGSALASAAAEALAAGLPEAAGADAGVEAAGVLAPGEPLAAGLQAAAPRTTDMNRTDHRNRP